MTTPRRSLSDLDVPKFEQIDSDHRVSERSMSLNVSSENVIASYELWPMIEHPVVENDEQPPQQQPIVQTQKEVEDIDQDLIGLWSWVLKDIHHRQTLSNTDQAITDVVRGLGFTKEFIEKEH